MAGKKTQAQLTPEEKLQQALVPEAEQSYKILANWCWTRLDKIVFITTGKKDANYGHENGKFPFFTCASEPIRCDDYSFDGESLLLPGNGANVGLVIYYNGKFEAYQRTYVLQSISKNFYLKFIYYNILTFWKEYNKDKQYGSATNYIKLGNFKNYCVPLPPLTEQQRIVERIESLFSKLDEAKENLQNVLDGFETRKAAILHKAFTGELTAKWRKQHVVSMESWEEKKLGDCGSLQRGRSKHRPRNDSRLFGEKYPFIQTGDVANAEMYIINHSKMLSDFGLQQSKIFPKGTLCITIAANIGKVGILTYDCCFPDSVVGFLPNNENICEFIYYKLTTLQKELEELAPATAQKNINLKLLNDLKINMPTLDEQTEIVRIIDYLLAKEQQAKELAENALAKIELIKKSILARAFRGELGTNNPADEPAVELLKRVL